METIEIDIEIVEPVLLEIGVESEMMVNPTPAPAFIRGEDGNGIASVTRTSGTGAPGTTDTYTITFTNGTTSTFTVVNGANGAPGNGIASVTRTSGTGAAGTTDTYTITFTNGTTSTFTVVNGANGANGAPGPSAVSSDSNNQAVLGTDNLIYVPGNFLVKSATISSAVTGTVDETQVYRILIPAGTLSAGDLLRIQFRIVKTGGSTPTFKMKIATSTTMPSGTTGQIALGGVGGGSGNRFYPFKREFSFDGTYLRSVIVTTNQMSDDTASNGFYTQTAFNKNIDNHLFLSIQPASSTDNLAVIDYYVTNKI
jgi:hypothetical protein